MRCRLGNGMPQWLECCPMYDYARAVALLFLLVISVASLPASSRAAVKGQIPETEIRVSGQPSHLLTMKQDRLEMAGAGDSIAGEEFGNCDPAIHDKLVGAEWRTPSDCEVKFNDFVRKALASALKPAIDDLTSHGWIVSRQFQIQPISSIPRHTEAKPFQLVEQEMHQGGEFYVSLGLPESSPVYQRLNQVTVEAMQRAISQAQAGRAVSMDSANDAARALDENTRIGLSVLINQASAGISNFKGGHTVTPLSGGGFAIEVPFTQAPTGGDITASQRVTFVFIGAWGPSPAGAQSGGSETIQVKGNLDSSAKNLMKVQNIRIRIQGGRDQAQELINHIDWVALRRLMAR